MLYRQFGKLNWNVSSLGFGAMRLPAFGKGMTAPINEPEAIKMIRYSIDHGVNYIDTAYIYSGGNSEKVVGKALQDGYRDKVRIATKLPINMMQQPEDFDLIFNEQLARFQTNNINFYLLHGLNRNGWRKVKEWGVISWVEEKVAAGKIDYLGFSFHDDYDVFKNILDYYDNWTFCQIQYNFVDVNTQAGRRGVEYAARKGLAIVVMEPLRGGMLTKTPPEKVARIWEKSPQKMSLAERALLWVWNQPAISVVLSGMSTMEQVIENLEIADRSRTGILSPQDIAPYDRAREAYKSLSPVPCTKCRYCTPCPNGVDIPDIFELYNETVIYNEPTLGRMNYNSELRILPQNCADKCVECGICAQKCPQQIDIPGWLKIAHERLSGKH